MRTGVMICGHGSRDPDAIREFSSLKAGLTTRLPEYDVDSGFLEFATPVIREGLDALAERGMERIIAIPGMLFAAGHVKNDVPSEINEFSRAHPDIDVRMGRDLAIDPKLLAACKERIEEALAANPSDVAREDTLLMVVGRGTNDADANSNVSKVARMLWEGMGFGWAEVCYSGVAHPRVAPGLERATKLGFKRVIVFPYFLFTGILIKRIRDETAKVRAANPEIDYIDAPYLADHPKVLDAFADRVAETLTGDNAMNCMLCKYREQIIGYEGEVGTPQVGHHHHVRGAGVDGHDHDHGHGHGHGHSHGHSHDHGHHHKHSHDDDA